MLWSEIRRAARRLVREPGLSAAAIATIAVGIGASSAMFSVVHSVLLRSMGIDAPERLVVLWPMVGETAGEFSWNAYRDIARGNATLDNIAVTGSVNWPARFVLDGSAVSVHGSAVSSTFFDVMGAVPAIGRSFRSDDDVPGAPPVVVISDGLWATYFNRDPAVIGRTVEVQEQPVPIFYEIVGVMSPDFFYPHGADYWIPALPRLALAAGGDPLEPLLEGLGVFHAVGRLKSGESIAALRADVTTLWTHRAAAAGLGNSRIGIGATPLLDHAFGRARRALVILMAAVLLVLFSACANVAGLLIARAASRTHDRAIRAALGATRRTFIYQALAEGLVLAVPGALIGVTVAAASLRGLVALSPAAIPRLDTTRLDAGVLAFAVAITAGSTLLLALLPALSRRHRAAPHVHTSGKGTVGASSRAGVRHALVVLQIATGVVLLIATGLTVRSFARLSSIDPGYDTGHVLTFSVAGLDDTRYPDRAERRDVIDRLTERVAHVPGVQGAAAVLLRPFGAGSIGWDSGLWLEGQGLADDAWQRNPTVAFEVVTPGYFDAMGISVRRGRDFLATDTANATPVAIVSDNLATRLWPGEDPIGKRLVDSFTRGEGTDPPRWHTVVGVVGNALYREIDRPRFDLYLPLRQADFNADHIVVRTSGAPRSFLSAITAAATEIDPHFSLADVATMDEIVAGVRGPWRFNMIVFSLFGIVSTALTALGLFGLVSCTAAQRRREFGIRLALGAEAWRVGRLVLREGAVLAAIGVMAGLLVSAAATRTIASLLFDTSATDGATFVAAPLVLTLVTILACYLPARRAASTDPAIVLREE